MVKNYSGYAPLDKICYYLFDLLSDSQIFVDLDFIESVNSIGNPIIQLDDISFSCSALSAKKRQEKIMKSICEYILSEVIQKYEPPKTTKDFAKDGQSKKLVQGVLKRIRENSLGRYCVGEIKSEIDLQISKEVFFIELWEIITKKIFWVGTQGDEKKYRDLEVTFRNTSREFDDEYLLGCLRYLQDYIDKVDNQGLLLKTLDSLQIIMANSGFARNFKGSSTEDSMIIFFFRAINYLFGLEGKDGDQQDNSTFKLSLQHYSSHF
jgi:hypothetical protein